MKKILFAIALVVTMGFCANAQTDGFFSKFDNGYDDRDASAISLPTQHGYDTDQNAPLGSGLVILTALGAGYAVARKRK